MMTTGKIVIYKNNGRKLGYYNQAQIKQFGQDEYAIEGIFVNTDGSTPEKIEFNPQSLPYRGVAEDGAGLKHKNLTNIYIQRGRQPVIMTALGQQ